MVLLIFYYQYPLCLGCESSPDLRPPGSPSSRIWRRAWVLNPGRTSLPSTVFKTAALNLSASSPNLDNYYSSYLTYKQLHFYLVPHPGLKPGIYSLQESCNIIMLMRLGGCYWNRTSAYLLMMETFCLLKISNHLIGRFVRLRT